MDLPERLAVRARRDRDLLVKDLSERLKSAKVIGDPAPVMAAVVPRLARNLAKILTGSLQDPAAADIQAMEVLVKVHELRYFSLPAYRREADMRAYLTWVRMLIAITADQVPDPVRSRVPGADTPTTATGDAAGETSARAIAVYQEYGRTGNTEHLQEAVSLFQDAVAATPVDHPSRPGRLSNLGNALRIRFERTGQLGDLDEAITSGRDAIAAAPADHPSRFMYLSNLGAALERRFERTGQLGDLDEAIGLFQDAVAATPADHPTRPEILSNLGAALGTRYKHTGKLDGLDEAITSGRDAIAAIPADHPDRPTMLSNLANTLQFRSERTGRQQDLTEAITWFREAAGATDHPDRPMCLSNLGNALRIRFERTGQLGDLDEAITSGRDAVAATPADHPDRPTMLSNLTNALGRRFEHTGQLSDLDEAITSGRAAVAATPADHPDRPMYLSNLGNTLQFRSERTGHKQDLNEAVSLFQDAVAATPADHPDRPTMLSNLANALGRRFERTGQLSDLDEAITAGRAAVAATPADHPDRPMYLSNLGNALQTRSERTGQLGDLNEAVSLFQDVVAATPADHPDRSMYLFGLGSALQARSERTGHHLDQDEAVTRFWEGAKVGIASPRWRLAAARGWGRCAVLARDFGTAVKGYEAAIGLLPLVVWHGLDQATREHHLREWAGLAGEAATAAVVAGDPVRAVQLAEAGRAMLWTQALHLRDDLAALRHRDPGLAAVLERARTVLNRTPGASTVASAGGLDALVACDLGQARAAERQMLEGRRQAAREWDAAVEQVRQLKGFEDFLQPVPFPQLRRAAADGPVVLVNVSRHGSHALIVVPETGPRSGSGPGLGVQVVDLPAASWETVIDQANTLLAARYRAGDLTVDPVTRVNDQYAVFDVLTWTWQAITEPVLTALGHTTTPDGPVEKWPRVWWCPLGPAAVLPLHAAGVHPRTGIQYAGMGEAAAIADTVAGRVVSSYTPTLTALTRARNRTAPAQARALVVGVPDAPDLRPLPGALPELKAVAAALQPASTDATYMISPTKLEPTFTVYSPPTRDTVLDALPRHSWLHLSCHGSQHPGDASRSAFWLRDAPLTLADLAALDLPDADLAYLAACQTATGDVQLLDEALHLASGMQLVGYRHVLATLWSIDDTVAPAMAQAIYTHLTHLGPDPDHPQPAGRPDSARAAYALHHAVTQLRQLRAGEPFIWAPYIHLGP